MVHIDTEVWKQRRRDRHGNDNGNGHGWQKWPWSAMVTLLLGLVAWVISSVLWLARLESDIQTVKLRDAELHTRVNAIGTQLDNLIQRTSIIDERQTTTVLRNNSQDERMERMERTGSRQIPVIEERLSQLQRRVDAIAQTLQQNNFRLQSGDSPR